MIQGKKIVCFAPNDWWAQNPSCTTHIMQELSKDNSVLYINPFSSDILGAKSSGKKKGLSVRIKRKLKSMFSGLKKINSSLHVFSPFFIPIQGKTVFDSFNNFFLRLQIKFVFRIIGFTSPILWIENIRAANALQWFKSVMVVYHVSDLFAKDSYSSNQKALEAKEQYVSDRSDLTICVSDELYDMKKDLWDNVHYLPHGVDFELFRDASERPIALDVLSGIPHPIAGYFGTMTANNDIEMMVYCARTLPDVSFVFAGQITTGDYSELASLNNVYLLGRLPYNEIPQLCAAFDVCMLQWKVTDWIRHCNPLKMLEYMASGNPIVSVEINEAKKYKDIISITETKEDFCRALMWEIENDNDERKKKRVEIASRHSWSSNVEKISEMIEETSGRLEKENAL